MAAIKRFIECAIPVTVCNLRCSYCYVIQRGNNKQNLPDMKYSPETIGRAFRRERWGGTCYISICGQGETLVPDETVPIVCQLLQAGHFVNVTTNGTLSRRFDQFLQFPEEMRRRLHFAFSLHLYTEKNRVPGVLQIYHRSVQPLFCAFPA